MKLKFLFLSLFFCLVAFGQNGTVTGTILDKEYNNESLSFANITIKGTSQGTSTDDKGKYTLTLKPGNYTLVIAYLGYETKEIPFTLKASEKKIINHTLEASGVQLKDVVVEYTVKKETEQALLQEQQKAVEIKQSIGAQEMTKKGVSDVAAAVVKTAGVTKQEGTSNIFVRGLGDRYNSTTLNGLPIPSNNPEKKNISLDLFNVDIVEYISIDKVYSTKIYGDFAGGNVDIKSKDFSGSGFLKLDTGVNGNTNALGQSNFLLQDGPNHFGFNKSSAPNTISQFGFENSLNPVSKTPYGFNFGLSGGNSFKVGEASSLNIFSTVSFGNEFSYREGIDRNVNSIGTPTKDFRSESFGYKTNTTGMFNAVYKINNANKLKYNFIFINSSEQSNNNYEGTIIDIADNDNGLLNRKTYEVNTVYINQLLGEHKFSDRTTLNWGLSYNTITSDMPDRIQNTFRFENGGYVFGQNQITDNHRYYQNLVENEMAANVSFDVKFKKKDDDTYKGKFTFGYSGRYKVRDFEATQFNFRILQNQTVDPNNLDAFFNQANLSSGAFEIATFRGNQFVPNALNPQVYSGIQIIQGGFGNVEYHFNDKLTAVVGLRTEQIFQEVEWNTQIDPIDRKDAFDRVEFLPSAILRYGLNEKNNLRFGASKTYTLPQIKERALFVYEDVTQIKVGNPDLYPSEDYNVDLKWEFFPAKEEVISVTTFGKYIINPINEVTISSATNDISFINTGDFGYVAGIELEVRKQLFNPDNEKNKLSAGLNVSYMYTNQELSSEKVRRETRYNVEFTDEEASFSGASDLLLNADVSFLRNFGKENNFMATIAYSQFSDRIYSLGTNTRGNMVDKSFGTLDLILRSKIGEKSNFSFAAKNLLNPNMERVQENAANDVIVQSFKRGINLSLGFSYQF